jgi:CubicO group peptidase (beta-lactamase class C family)
MATGSTELTGEQRKLGKRLKEVAERLAVPGVAAGIYQAGQERYSFHGVTSIENPLPVDDGTLFQLGSIGKTYTATALMRLVERGELELDAPVRRYVPELRLKDEAVASSVTLLQLLNHSAGWQGDLMDDTGDGDDALARYVERMAGIEQEFPLGPRWPTTTRRCRLPAG